ncbi:CHAD domain-containing protein [Nitratireductor aquibiodomus]|uniref:CHAD domain-containing protein n=1 Tax=Nitratireductor aquibiodomus TaxID=204799 RepID=UPI0019D3678C|nr:CHAD domain-containing protein [Nitratireductor aquibiodomus]
MSEVELKLLLDRQQVPAVLARIEELPSQACTKHASRLLRSIYFDTAARDLRKNGISLRLRRDGKRWLQTVKLNGTIAGGLSKVSEFERPVPSGQVSIDAIEDADVRERLRKLISDRPLKTIAETHINRTQIDLSLDDGAKAELAVDSGAIKAAGRSENLHELEIELVEGAPADLYRTARMILPKGSVRFSRFSKAARSVLLAEQGHIEPPATPRRAEMVPLKPGYATGEAARAMLHECLSQITANIEAVRQCDDPEGPHQLRIGLRRLRSALALFAHEIASPEEAAPGLSEEARWLGREVGRLRDLDVVLNDIARPYFALDGHAHGAAPVLGTLERHAKEIRNDLRQILCGERVGDFLLSLSEFIETASWKDDHRKKRERHRLTDFAGKTLDRRWAHVLTKAKGIERFDQEQKHALRKELKKLRYTIEFLGPLFPKRDVKRVTERLKTLQTVFGSLNDATVVEAVLSKPPLSSINDLAAQRAIGRLLGACETRVTYDWTTAQAHWKALKTCHLFWKRKHK